MSRGSALGERLAEVSVRVLVPLSAAVVLVSVVIGRDRGVSHDLHVLAPDLARSGDALPVRSHLYVDLGRPQGGRLATADATATLRTPTGAVLARRRLAPSLADTLDGLLELPLDYAGAATLRVSASIDDRPIAVDKEIEIRGELESAPPPTPRPLRALQQLSAGPIRSASAEHEAPSQLRVRVAGGACVPEQPCDLFVHMGAPAASLRVVATPSVSPDENSARASEVTELVVPLRVVTHGAEAHLSLLAERGGEAVARRTLRLPVAQAAAAPRASARVVREGGIVEVGLHGSERGCIVDAFAAGHWVRTGSLPECQVGEPLPFAGLGPGAFRLQLRRDPFSANSAAVHNLYMRRQGQGDAGVLRALARLASRRDAGDRLAREAVRLAARPLDAVEFDAVSGYLLSLLDEGIVSPPQPVSSYPQALAELGRTRARVRVLALVVLVLGALTLALMVARRGLLASSEATRIMAEAGEAPDRLERQRLRRILGVLATVLSLLLAFVAIAMYVIARGRTL